MADFNLLKSKIILIEGGDSNNPNDTGGKTRLGISQHEYPQLNIFSLTEEQCFELLNKDYFVKYRLNEINEQIIAEIIFFAIINMNPIAVGKLVQTALNELNCTLEIDGVMGNKTIQALNSLIKSWTINYFISLFKNYWCKYYLKLTDDNPKQIHNFRGWIRRVMLC